MNLKGEIVLNGSKSISNRVLIIQALSPTSFEIKGLSNARDTVVLNNLLNKLEEPLLDAGEAGTAYRFLTAFLAVKGKDKVLMGNKRMCERPIGVLADALNNIGANIHYIGKSGYPPLHIKIKHLCDWGSRINISANVSSQYISALLMIAPVLPHGLELILEGKVISRPYIQMTLNLMEKFGAMYIWHNNMIKVPNQNYSSMPISIEADWSAASYYYSLAAIADNAEIQLNGLFENSVQGDSVLVKMMESFGVITTFNKNGILLQKKPVDISKFNYDFSDCPDIAQTLAVLCSALNIPAVLTGLETLSIKETDRISALKTELGKLGCKIHTTADTIHIEKGIRNKNQRANISTYKDHRMAMSFAPLTLVIKNLTIQDKEVVNKSYPQFWEDFKTLGLFFD